MHRHGGNLTHLARQAGCLPAQVLDFSANINPLGPPACVAAALVDAAQWLGHYPDPDCTDFIAAVAEHLDIAPERIVAGNGAEQLIWWLPRLLEARRVVLPSPCYLDYRRAAEVWKLPVVTSRLSPEQGFGLDLQAVLSGLQAGDLVWIGQPNNPTGRLVDRHALAAAVASRPDVHWAIDEAFIDFTAETASIVRWDLPNLAVIRSMTKFYALPALRLGYVVLPPQQASALRRLLPEWSVNTFAQQLGNAVLRDPARADYAERTRQLVAEERGWLTSALGGLGAAVTDGRANYLLLRLPDEVPSAATLAGRLLRDAAIAVRPCANYDGLDDRYVRVAVRPRDENQRLVDALRAQLQPSIR